MGEPQIYNMSSSESVNISEYLKTFLKKNVAYTLSLVFERSVIFLLLPFYTNLLSHDDYGDYNIFIATVSIGIFLYSLGIENSLIKFKAENFDHSKLDSTILVGMLSSASVFTILIIIFSNQIASLLFSSALYNDFVFILAFCLFFDTIIRFYMYSVVGEQKSRIFLFISIAKGLLTIALNVILVYFLDYGIQGAVWSYLITTFTIALFLIISKSVKLNFSFDLKLYKKLFKYSAPVMITSALIMLLNFGDTYIIKYFFDVEEVGKYSASYKFGTGMNMLVTAYATAIIPFSLNLLSENKGKKRIIKIASQGFFNVMICLFVFISLFYYELINLNIDGLFLIINPNFHQAVNIIPIIVAAYIFMGIYTNATVAYHYSGNTAKLALISAIAVVINIGLNICLVPIYSYWGAAFATLISFLILALITQLIGQKILSLDYNYSQMFLLFVGAIGIYLFSYFYLSDYLFVKILMFLSFLAIILFNFRSLKSN